MFTLYAKPSNHLFIAHQPVGIAMIIEIITSFKKSLLINCTMPLTLEPNTFLIPISFLFTSAVQVANPNNPRQEIKIAMPANTLKSIPERWSVLYCASKLLSKKIIQNTIGVTESGLYVVNVTIGTPKQQFLVQLDIQNNGLFIQDKSCGNYCNHTFDSSKSSTYRFVSQNTSLGDYNYIIGQDIVNVSFVIQGTRSVFWRGVQAPLRNVKKIIIFSKDHRISTKNSNLFPT